MTPQQIFEYKLKWKKGTHYCVYIHSDLRSVAVGWCKKLDKWEWSHIQYTCVYEDCFLFENKLVAQQFEEEFIRWVVKK